MEADEAAPASKAKATPARKSTRKGKAKAVEEVYCICKSRKPGAMIECMECQDWSVPYTRYMQRLMSRFHFDCIDLTPDEADLICECSQFHYNEADVSVEYRCRDCEAITGKKTSRKSLFSALPVCVRLRINPGQGLSELCKRGSVVNVDTFTLLR